VDKLVTALPGLARRTAVEALATVGAARGRRLRELHTHLTDHPNALTSGESACPKTLVLLAHRLLSAGVDQVQPPRCLRCGLPASDLPAVRGSGRICLACYRREKRTICARCGRSTRPKHRREDGIICSPCRDAEPASRGQCPICGRHRPLRRSRSDQTMRCATCIPRRQHTCTGCGTVAPATKIIDKGPVCQRCYQYPQRRCGGCGEIRAMSNRATGDTPDLCAACRPRTRGTCAVCGRHTFANRTNHGRGELVCASCRPRTAHPCAICGQTKPVQARFPAGPVCRSCYERAKRDTSRCGSCGRRGMIVGSDPGSGPICRTCAGMFGNYTCPRCGRPGRTRSRGSCQRCRLADRVDRLLAADGVVNAQLLPLADALKEADQPHRVLGWLRNSQAAQLLGQLAAAGEPVTHQLLDQQPQRQIVHNLRHILIRAQVLPDRDDHLHRIRPWLDKLLADEPPSRATIVHRYAEWLHNNDQHTATRAMLPSAGYHRRRHLRATLHLLTGLDTNKIALGLLTADDLTTWNDTAERRSDLRRFLRWAHQQGLVPVVSIPAVKDNEVDQHRMDGRDAFRRLHRCLHTTDLPLDVRVAGAMTLLYGLTGTQLVGITTDQLADRGDRLHLAAGRARILLPPTLAQLVQQLAAEPKDPSLVSRVVGETMHLFPGTAAGRPMRPSALTRKLARHGIHAGPARITAIAAFAAELPTAVVSEMLGVDDQTISRWSSPVQ
jgi:hypothetical protein